jgi:pheromone shutdown protein TraB
LDQKIGRILLIIATGVLAVIAVVQLARGEYLSAGTCFFGAAVATLAYVLSRRRRI